MDLLAVLKSSRPKVVHAAVFTLHRTFAALIAQGRIHGKLKHTSEQSQQVHEWLKSRYQDYVGALCSLLASDDQHLNVSEHWTSISKLIICRQLSALKVLLDLLRLESARLTSLAVAYKFADNTWRKIVQAILNLGEQSTNVKAEFLGQSLNHYDDLRCFFLKEATLRLQQSTDSQLKVAQNLLYFLEGLYSMPSAPEHLNRFLTTTPEVLSKLASRNSSSANKGKKRKRSIKDVGTKPVEDGSTGIFDSSSSSESESKALRQLTTSKQKIPELLSIRSHKKSFQNCWLAMLPCLRDEDSLKRVLLVLHKSVLPNMLNPETLMDFLGDCYDHGAHVLQMRFSFSTSRRTGGTIALLALNGLFTLITKNNLYVFAF